MSRLHLFQWIGIVQQIYNSPSPTQLQAGARVLSSPPGRLEVWMRIGASDSSRRRVSEKFLVPSSDELTSLRESSVLREHFVQYRLLNVVAVRALIPASATPVSWLDVLWKLLPCAVYVCIFVLITFCHTSACGRCRISSARRATSHTPDAEMLNAGALSSDVASRSVVILCIVWFTAMVPLPRSSGF